MTKKIDHKIKSVRVSLRLPAELHRRLQAQAQHERRSLHGQIVWLLEHTIPATDAAGSPRHRVGDAAE
jgi:hypothetical protein